MDAKEFNELKNKRNKMNGLELLSVIPEQSIKLAFFDPQYRGVMDKLAYGNEKADNFKNKSRVDLPAMDEQTIKNFINGIDRALMKSGHLMLWIDKFHLCEGIHEWVKGTSLELVDMITWDKGRIGMGFRSRRRSEYLVILQKKPKRVKGCWTVHNIPDVWIEKVKATHTHSKPIGLQKALIEATTDESDLILDPASGGWSVLQACAETHRSFIGSDLLG